MQIAGSYSPPTNMGGNSQGGEGACKALVLRDTEGSISSPPTIERKRTRHEHHRAVVAQ